MGQIGEIKPAENSIKLDKKDRKILSLLMLDAKINLSEISKKVELSKSNVARRITKMENDGLITGYHAFINFSKLEIKTSLILIKTQATPNDKDTYINKLISNKNIYGITEHTGEFDLVIAIQYKTEEEKDLTLDKILTNKIIKKFEIFETKTLFPRLNYTEEIPDKFTAEKNKSYDTPINIDAKDLIILKSLAKNCKTPLIDLATKLKLPRETLSYRIKKLTATKTIAKFQPNVNYFMLKSEFYLLRFQLSKPSKKSELIKYLSDTLKANSIIESNGSYQVMAFINFKDTSEFRNFENDLFSNFSDIIKDYSFELAKAQHKLDWTPISITEIHKKEG